MSSSKYSPTFPLLSLLFSLSCSEIFFGPQTPLLSVSLGFSPARFTAAERRSAGACEGVIHPRVRPFPDPLFKKGGAYEVWDLPRSVTLTRGISGRAATVSPLTLLFCSFTNCRGQPGPVRPRCLRERRLGKWRDPGRCMWRYPPAVSNSVGVPRMDLLTGARGLESRRHPSPQTSHLLTRPSRRLSPTQSRAPGPARGRVERVTGPITRATEGLGSETRAALTSTCTRLGGGPSGAPGGAPTSSSRRGRTAATSGHVAPRSPPPPCPARSRAGRTASARGARTPRS